MKELRAIVPGEYIKHLRWKTRFGKDLDEMRSGTRFRKHGCQLTSLLDSCDNATSLSEIASAIEHYDKCVEKRPLIRALLSHNYSRYRVLYIAALQLPVITFLCTNNNHDLINNSLAVASSVTLIGLAVFSYKFVVGKFINPYKTIHQDLFSHIFNRISLAKQGISVSNHNSDMSKLLRPFKWLNTYTQEIEGRGQYEPVIIGSGELETGNKILLGATGYKIDKKTHSLADIAVVTGLDKTLSLSMTSLPIGKNIYEVESAEPISEKLDFELGKFNSIFTTSYIEIKDGSMLVVINRDDNCTSTILSDFKGISTDYSVIDLLSLENRNTVFTDMITGIIKAI